jgi:hypothetical protein
MSIIVTLLARRTRSLLDEKTVSRHGFVASQAREFIESRAAQNNRIDLQGTRVSSVCLADILYHKRITRMTVGAGIVLNNVSLLCQGLAPTFIPGILKEEEMLQEEKMKTKDLCLIWDATPHLGDLFVLVMRYVQLDDSQRTAMMEQCLIHLAFLKKTKSVEHFIFVVNQGGRGSVTLRPAEDGCSVNLQPVVL